MNSKLNAEKARKHQQQNRQIKDTCDLFKHNEIINPCEMLIQDEYSIKHTIQRKQY
jgi:hypothetical protein